MPAGSYSQAAGGTLPIPGFHGVGPFHRFPSDFKVTPDLLSTYCSVDFHNVTLYNSLHDCELKATDHVRAYMSLLNFVKHDRNQWVLIRMGQRAFYTVNTASWHATSGVPETKTA